MLAFSLPVVSAVLSGVAISGANYTRIEAEHRLEMLRVAHKLVLATSFFILFVLAYFFLTVFTKAVGQVNPNSLAWVLMLKLKWHAIVARILWRIVQVLRRNQVTHSSHSHANHRIGCPIVDQ